MLLSNETSIISILTQPLIPNLRLLHHLDKVQWRRHYLYASGRTARFKNCARAGSRTWRGAKPDILNVMGCYWDADRLNLLRLGIEPEPHRMSTPL
jgi:hypothetical protein